MRGIPRTGLLLIGLFLYTQALFALTPPQLQLTVEGTSVSANWTGVEGAEGYRLYYAPYPQGTPVNNLDLGNLTAYSIDLWDGAAFYAAVEAYDQTGGSGYSNIESFSIDLTPDDTTTANNSFFPHEAVDSQGNRINPYWVYKVNQGQPIVLSNNGVSMTATIQNIRLEIDYDRMQRKATLDAQASGNGASGVFTIYTTENIQRTDGKTLIEDQDIDWEMTMSASGISMEIAANIHAQFSSPVEWFLDRSDLDTLGIGYVHDADDNVPVTVSGDITMDIGMGSPLSIPVPAYSATTSEVWEITGSQSSMTVQGVTYDNIVEVRRTTSLPDMSSDLMDVIYKEVEIDYWVAKGIGMIKGTGQFEIQGQPLDVELIETNLD